jgi:hypothetical protein
MCTETGTDGLASVDAVADTGAGELNTLVGPLLILVPLSGRRVSGDIFIRTAGAIAVGRNSL